MAYCIKAFKPLVTITKLKYVRSFSNRMIKSISGLLYNTPEKTKLSAISSPNDLSESPSSKDLRSLIVILSPCFQLIFIYECKFIQC